MAGWRAAMFLAVALLLASSCEDLVHIHISGPVEFAGWTVAVDGENVDVLLIKAGEREQSSLICRSTSTGCG